MCLLAQIILALAIAHAPPGRSLYSFEIMHECGADSKHPACQLAPVCSDSSPFCKPPHWSQVRAGWVRVESRETAIQRYARIAQAANDAAGKVVSCRNPDGSLD